MIPEYRYEFWQEWQEDRLELTFFMPNGIVIPLESNRNATLLDVKEELWEVAAKYPLYGVLHDMSMYVFVCINHMAEKEHLFDESKRICDVKPFCCILMIAERNSEKPDKNLSTQISHLIGKGLHEFQKLQDREVNDFRLMMRLFAEDISKDRKTKTWIDKLNYQFPPRISNQTVDQIKSSFMNKFSNNNIVIDVYTLDTAESKFKFRVPYTITPSKFLITVLNKKATSLNIRGEMPKDYILKVCGREEYISVEYPLIKYLYIQECLLADVIPTLVCTSILNVPIIADNLYENPEEILDRNDSYSGSRAGLQSKYTSSTLTLRKKGKFVSSWDIDQNFHIYIHDVISPNCDTNKSVDIGLQIGLFHGGVPLCSLRRTSEKSVLGKDGYIHFDEKIEFDIKVANIPRMTRLCFAVYEVCKTNVKSNVKQRRIKDLTGAGETLVSPLAWVNTTVYDYKCQLKNGAMTLYMWSYAEDIQSENLVHSLGTIVSNPIREHTTHITLSFPNYDQGHTILYPSQEKLLDMAQTREISSGPHPPKTSNFDYLTLNDPMHDMHEQDYKDIWNLRFFFMDNEPHLLPRVLQAIEWNNRQYISEITFLLTKWPKLRVEKALELLDYAYADEAVRSFAVSCIESVSDEELSLYLLQLVQALKHECFLACDLVKFLLRRALSNQKIGHFVFWHLRSEMDNPSVSVRFGLILEAYCLGSPEHVPILLRQMDCLDKLKNCSEQVKLKPNKDKAKQCLNEHLYTITDILNPLNPSYRCKKIKLDKCKIMDSKMRPLWIVFENNDEYGEDIYIIMKNGDDLRQDMLTLQMLKIMDKLWKNEGLDLKMNLYNCISMEHRVGMIEVVLNAETIANIQKERGIFSATSAFRRGSLLAWLREHNPTDSELDKAIDQFTLSCAGYCVATYVLGIADRHSDNIMIKKNGQLFHIDFGHILGHFKEKFGIRRERVPFVLTHDFVHVINKGKKDAMEFTIFQQYCERAFTILRKHGQLILSLFAMMISTGLPELSSEKDLNYLRDTLVLGLDDAKALAHFRSKFEEALSNSWKTSLNWASHNMSKNNKQ